MKWKFLILASLLAWFGRDGVRAQQRLPVSSLQEDCSVTFNFTVASSGAQAAGTTTAGSTGTTAIIDNRQIGCLDWLVTYEPTTAVATVSLAFQTATNVAGTPTTWSNYPGTLVSGINPNTAITSGGAVTEATGTAYPFLRMNMTVLTGGGRIQGKLYGWKRRPTYVTVTSGGGCPGTSGTPCVVNLSQLGGVSVSDCDQQALFNLSGSGNTQIIAASGTTTIRICHISFSTTAAEDIKIVRGTGANCVTGPTDLTGLYKSVQSMALDFEPWGPLKGAASGAICLNQSVAQALGGLVVYAYVP